VEFIVVTATVDIVQLYCIVCGVCCGYSKSRYSEKERYCVFVEMYVFKARVDIKQWYCVVCGGYCGYSNSSYGAIVLCCVRGVYCG